MKTYRIVTNDKMEMPVKYDIRGAKEVAECLGKTVNRVRINICRDHWSHLDRYKAVVDDSEPKKDTKEMRRCYCKRYDMTHDRSEYFKKRYLDKKIMAEKLYDLYLKNERFKKYVDEYAGLNYRGKPLKYILSISDVQKFGKECMGKGKIIMEDKNIEL